MTREIKFRSWDKSRNEMFIPSAIVNPTDNEITVIEGGDYRLDKFRLGEYFLMQFIGLKDKKGKEVFEGDIISRAGAYILWNDRLACWCFNFKKAKTPDTPLFHVDIFEIIGNIYENPELLET